MVPPTVLFLAQHPLVDNYDVSSARQIFCAGAPLAPEIAEEAMRRLYNVTSVRQGQEIRAIFYARIVYIVFEWSANNYRRQYYTQQKVYSFQVKVDIQRN